MSTTAIHDRFTTLPYVTATAQGGTIVDIRGSRLQNCQHKDLHKEKGSNANAKNYRRA